MRIMLTLDTNADMYEMTDAWENPPRGRIINIPEPVWIRYQEAAADFYFWQDYIYDHLTAI